jgi:predicted nucleic-acid-binding Zn-ribbon protein
MNPVPQCSKCGGEAKEGFVLDHGYGKRFLATWIAGQPEENFLGNPKVMGRETRPIRTFCCQKCGYLESYAFRE